MGSQFVAGTNGGRCAAEKVDVPKADVPFSLPNPSLFACYVLRLWILRQSLMRLSEHTKTMSEGSGYLEEEEVWARAQGISRETPGDRKVQKIWATFWDSDLLSKSLKFPNHRQELSKSLEISKPVLSKKAQSL